VASPSASLFCSVTTNKHTTRVPAQPKLSISVMLDLMAYKSHDPEPHSALQFKSTIPNDQPPINQYAIWAYPPARVHRVNPFCCLTNKSVCVQWVQVCNLKAAVAKHLTSLFPSVGSFLSLSYCYSFTSELTHHSGPFWHLWASPDEMLIWECGKKERHSSNFCGM